MILKVSEVTSLFELESSFAKKKSPDASEIPISTSKRNM